MLLCKYLNRVVAFAEVGKAAGLSAYDGIFGLRFPVFAVGFTIECALVVVVDQEAVVVAGEARLSGRHVGLGPGYGVGQRPAVHFHFCGRRTQFELPACRESVQKGFRDMFARQPVLRRLGVGYEVGGVVPLAPASNEAGLHDVNNVRVFLQNGLDLSYVTEDLLFIGVKRSVVLRVGKVPDVV